MGQGACGEAEVLGRVILGCATLLGLRQLSVVSTPALNKVLDILGVGEEPQKDTLQSSLDKAVEHASRSGLWTHKASFRF